MRLTIIAMAIAVAQLMAIQPAVAQTSPSENQKATVLFDLRIDKMRQGELAQSLDVDDQDLEALSQASGGGMDITKVNRIFGVVSLPNSVQELMAAQDPTADLPLDFFVQIQFADSESAQQAFQAAEADSEQEVIDGKTFIRPPGSPGNLVAQMFDETTMEVGTKNYILQGSRGRELFSAGLSSGWGKIPDHGLRIVIDLDGERDLINDAVEMAKVQSGGDPTMAAYLGLLGNAKDFRLSFDPDNATMLELGMTGVDESKAAELQSGLASLLGIAKMSGPMAAQQIPDPKAGAMVTEILNSLDAKQDGVDVRVSIPRPEGFTEAIQGAVEQLKGALLMGAPGGGF